MKDLRSMSHDISLILDVRSRDEFDSGHVPSALNIPLPDLNRESVRSATSIHINVSFQEYNS